MSQIRGGSPTLLYEETKPEAMLDGISGSNTSRYFSDSKSIVETVGTAYAASQAASKSYCDTAFK